MARKKWKKKERLQKTAMEKAEAPKQKNLKIGYIIAALVVIAVGGYYLLGQSPGTDSSTPPVTKNVAGNYVIISDKANTHIAGKVEVLEFFDFYCSHCYRFHVTSLPQLRERYGESFELVDLGYPLRDRSIPPIEAYMIAQDMGKGEEMKDAIFRAIHVDGREVSDVENLADLADSTGLDREAFEEALSSRVKQSIVDENRRLGNSYGLRGTPTFIIDGNIKAEDSSISNLQAIIDSVLEDDAA